MHEELQQYVAELAERFGSEVSSIWLFGSRANGSERPLSDWDLLVFASPEVLESLRRDKSLQRGAADVLVVYDRDRFEKPWGSKKRGSLSEWKWKSTGDSTAEYQSVKFLEETAGSQRGQMQIRTLIARCLCSTEPDLENQRGPLT